MNKHNFNDGMIQYMLWNTCNNHCKFCSLQYSKVNDDRVNNVKRVIDYLDLDEAKPVERISLVGGELFFPAFSTELRDIFYKLINKIFSLDKRLFLMTNLIYDKNVEFENCINYIDSIGHLNDTVICTSFDLEGRFHNDSALKLFKTNCDYVKSKLGLHIEMVLSYSLMKGVLDNKFSFKNFFEEYTDNVDFMPPYPGIEKRHLPEDFLKDFDFFPKRNDFFAFLKKCFLDDKILNPNRFLNRSFHSCILYYFLDGVYIKNDERQVVGNMHHDQYNYCDDYIHSMTKDYNMFKEMYNL